MHERERQPDKPRTQAPDRNVQRGHRAQESGLTGPLAPDAIADLQRRAGNRVVSAMLEQRRGPAVQRATDEESGSVSGASEGTASRVTQPAAGSVGGASEQQAASRGTQSEAGEVSGPSEEQDAPHITQSESDLLHRYRQETQDPRVQALLDELLPLLDRVTFVDNGGGMWFTTKADSGESGQRYHIYADDEDIDRLARLVHELTHVGVDVAYDADMLNYPAPQLSGQTPDREEDRQMSRRRLIPAGDRGRFEDHVQHNATELLNLIPGSGLPPDIQQKASQKLTAHTMGAPYKEYDAVLSHLLTWCDRHAPAEDSPFRRRLAEMVEETQRWRQNQRVDPPRHRREQVERLLAELRIRFRRAVRRGKSALRRR